MTETVQNTCERLHEHTYERYNGRIKMYIFKTFAFYKPRWEWSWKGQRVMLRAPSFQALTSSGAPASAWGLEPPWPARTPPHSPTALSAAPDPGAHTFLRRLHLPLLWCLGLRRDGQMERKSKCWNERTERQNNSENQNEWLLVLKYRLPEWPPKLCSV